MTSPRSQIARSPVPPAVALAVLVGAPLLAAGCGEEPPPGPRETRVPDEADAEPEEDPDWDDYLSAIGYADFADEAEPGEADAPVLLDAERAAPGYTLVTSIPHAAADLLDLEGEVVHSWSTTRDAATWDRAELGPDGRLWVIEFPLDPDDGSLSAFSDMAFTCYGWDGELLWSVPLPAHHDFDLDADGRALVLGRRELRPREGLVVVDDTAVVVSPDGEIERDESLLDLLRTKNALRNRLDKRIRGLDPEESPHDVLHANSIAWLQHEELTGSSPLHRERAVLVCLRHRNGIAAIDLDAREVLWSWGADELVLPHEAIWLANGHVMVFDNGSEARPWSRIVEVDPATNEIVWEYRADPQESFYTAARGTSQELANGNVLVADSDSGVVFEITRAGETVWRYANRRTTDGRRGTLRAIRYEPERVEPLLAGTR